MLPGKCIHCRLTTSAARIARWALTQDCQYIALSNDAFYFFHDFYFSMGLKGSSSFRVEFDSENPS